MQRSDTIAGGDFSGADHDAVLEARAGPEVTLDIFDRDSASSTRSRPPEQAASVIR